MKFQPRRGQHASFWSMPAAQEAGEGSARRTGAEIDVIEWFGENHPQGGLVSFIHHWPDDNKAGVTSQKVGGYIKKPGQYDRKWAERYHVFLRGVDLEARSSGSTARRSSAPARACRARSRT